MPWGEEDEEGGGEKATWSEGAWREGGNYEVGEGQGSENEKSKLFYDTWGKGRRDF